MASRAIAANRAGTAQTTIAFPARWQRHNSSHDSDAFVLRAGTAEHTRTRRRFAEFCVKVFLPTTDFWELALDSHAASAGHLFKVWMQGCSREPLEQVVQERSG